MRITLAMLAILGVSFPLIAGGQEKQAATKTATIEPLPRDLEIQLALSALPPHLRDSATAYVLNPAKGFEIAQRGTNGFHAFVARTGDDAMQGSWPLTSYPEDILYPVSFDSAGAKANMRVYFDIAELQAKGMRSDELKKLIQKRFKSNYYKAPERAGVSYMLAPILRTYVNPDKDDTVSTANFPHVMHYAPDVSNEDIGAATPSPEELRYTIEHGRWKTSPHPFVIHQGPHGYVVQQRGASESAAIKNEYEAMLGRLCEIKKVWCLPQ
jgi:hypothetical protein